ncbi:MAG: hypothetical protein INR65_00585 [Gluconacetobacter diazotrophicus]|nr:hypothetical protein [Gluconacetobacter diazotrophicus]
MPGRPLRPVHGCIDEAADVGVALGGAAPHQSEGADHHGEHVVEVVCDAAGQLNNRLQLLQLPHLSCRGLAPGLGADEGASAVPQVGCGDRPDGSIPGRGSPTPAPGTGIIGLLPRKRVPSRRTCQRSSTARRGMDMLFLERFRSARARRTRSSPLFSRASSPDQMGPFDRDLF